MWILHNLHTVFSGSGKAQLKFTVTSSGENPFSRNDIANIPNLAGNHSSEGLGDAGFGLIKHLDLFIFCVGSS